MSLPVFCWGTSFATPNTSGSGSGIFSDNFTSNSGWTQTGTLVDVNNSVSGKLAFAGATNGTDRRVTKSLGLTLSDTTWRAEFLYNATAKNIPSHTIFSFVDTVGEWDATTADCIGIKHEDDDKLYVCTKDSATGPPTNAGTGIAISLSTDYYIRLERTTSTNVKLSIFSDSARTSHVTGSPQNGTVSANCISLDNIQASTYAAGSGARSLTSTIDDLVVYDTLA